MKEIMESFQGDVPKICVPLVGKTREKVQKSAEEIKNMPVDVIEWRTDYFEENTAETLALLSGIKGDIPLLCTFRTKQEGGEREISPEEYESTLKMYIESGFCDMVDIELSAGEETVKRLIARADEHGVATVVSKHDFQKTPSKKEMVETFLKMHELGADLPKYAVMPNGKEDVLILLSASLESHRRVGKLVAISMGELGKISRVSGGYFGSCMTFAAAEKASAPGQIPVTEASEILKILCD